MSTTPDRDQEQAASWALSPEREVAPDATIHRGQAARSASAALLAEITADDAESADQVQQASRAGVGGRPSLSSGTPGISPTWSLRVPAELDAAMRARAEREGTSLADLLRRIATSYVREAS